VYIQAALNYFLDLSDLGVTPTPSMGSCPSTCVSTTCWKRLVALKRGLTLDPNIEGYKDALGEITLLTLRQKFSRK
jgi:hypothetical protein